MNHLKWMGHGSTILDIQRRLRNDLESCEVTLVGKGHCVRAHRFVLSSCSDLCKSLLANVPIGDEATIMVPDIKGALLDSVLSFIYLGETSLSSVNLSEFLEATNILGIKSAISFECTASAGGEGIPISDITIEHDDNIVEQECINEQKIITDTLTEHTTRELEFLDVYNEASQKITYSIEPVATENEEEFILTENSGTYTMTQASVKIDGTIQEEEIETEVDDETEEAQIIEDYTVSVDPIIEIEDNHSTLPITSTPINNNNKQTTTLKLKPTSIKAYKISSSSDTLANVKIEELTGGEDISTFIQGQNIEGSPIDLAIQAVLQEGMSLQKAAHKYDVSKTVLWRRVRKHPNYSRVHRENPVFTIAYERLKNGGSLKSISKELDIPMSTLHRHKVRLAQEGRLPNYVQLKKRDSVSKEQFKEKIEKAVNACVQEGMSQNHAANLYDIPKSTLWRHLQKRVAEAELSSQTLELKEEIILS